MIVALDGPRADVFKEVVALMPDGKDWLVSDTEGSVVIAREESALVREAILTTLDDGTFDLELLASHGVSERALQALVVGAALSCLVAVVGSLMWGPGGLMGLIVGVTLAGTLPSVILAIGQRLLDPGRDEPAEKHLERAMRFAIAECTRAQLISTDG